MPNRLLIWFPALLVVVVLAHTTWRYFAARAIAEEWLSRHRYRPRSLRLAWFSFMRFAPRLFRNEARAFQFRGEVDDMRLGGTGILWLRVWTDWLGLADREPDLSWERMPVAADDGSRTMEDRMAATQLALLQQVAGGVTTFRTRARTTEAGADFDEVVEHVMALARRGLVSCDTPMLNVRGDSQYESVSNVSLTERGRRLLADSPS